MMSYTLTTTQRWLTIDKDFRLALGTCGVALVLDQIPIIKWLPGLPLTLLGILFLIQT